VSSSVGVQNSSAQPAPAASATATATVETKKDDDGPTDHQKVVGHVGVGYFGVSQQPIGQGNANAVTRGTVQMPVIGVRYWLNERIGLDLGLGFNFFSSSRSVEANNLAEVKTDGPAVVALGFHGGVPIALAHAKHYKFLVVPELNVGYATQTEAAQNVGPGAPIPPDIQRTGFRFDVGARVGSEIHFGFIGVPQLALQASVGLNFRHQVWHASQDAGPPAVAFASSSTDRQNNFGTTVQSDPWAIFVNNIAAIYYFP
jgi:hypothetical protein